MNMEDHIDAQGKSHTAVLPAGDDIAEKNFP
jgi:hypothetical protein